MSEINIFEVATRDQYRFPTAKGLLSTEELWGLPLTSEAGKVNLNDIYADLFAQIEAQGKAAGHSLEAPAPKGDQTLGVKVDIVKHIYNVRKAENKAKLDKAARRETARILEQAIRDQEANKIASTPLDELKAQLAALQAADGE